MQVRSQLKEGLKTILVTIFITFKKGRGGISEGFLKDHMVFRVMVAFRKLFI